MQLASSIALLGFPPPLHALPDLVSYGAYVDRAEYDGQLELDLGNLTAWDPGHVDANELRADPDGTCLRLATAMTQSLVAAIFRLPSEAATVRSPAWKLPCRAESVWPCAPLPRPCVGCCPVCDYAECPCPRPRAALTSRPSRSGRAGRTAASSQHAAAARKAAPGAEAAD